MSRQFDIFCKIPEKKVITDILIEVRKILDEQFSFNNTLIQQIKNADNFSFFEIMIVFFLGSVVDLDAIDLRSIFLKTSSELLKEFKELQGSGAHNDAKAFQGFLDQVDSLIATFTQEDLESFYVVLCIYCQSMMDVFVAHGKQVVLKFLSILNYEGAEKVKFTKKAIRLMLKGEAASVSDIKSLKFCIALLEPYVSTHSFKYIQNLKIQEDSFSISLFSWRFCFMDIFECIKNDALLSGFEKQADSLFESMRFLENEFREGYANVKNIRGFGDIYKIYRKLSICYEEAKLLQKEIKNHIKEETEESVLASFQMIPNLSKKKNKNKNKKKKTRNKLRNANTKKKIVANEKAEKKSIEIPLEASHDCVENTLFEKESLERTNENDSVSTVEINNNFLDDLQTEIQPSDVLISEETQQFHSVQQKKECLLTNLNTLKPTDLAFDKLKSKHKTILLQIFKDQSCVDLTVRDLCNVAKALGAVIETSGSATCRIKIRNIYTKLLISNPSKLQEYSQTLSQSRSATVTMHGGLHRSKPSQNHDREIPPKYFVEQFRQALIRANCTPELLWPEEHASTPLITQSR